MVDATGANAAAERLSAHRMRRSTTTVPRLTSISTPRRTRPCAPHRPEGPLVASSPVLFTVAFRREMARLPAAQRQEWLSALASQMAQNDRAGEPLELRE